MLKGIYHSLTFRLGLFGIFTGCGTYFAMTRQWEWLILILIGWLYSMRMMSELFKRNAQKVAFMFDAIDNSDYAFQYATRGRSSNDKLVSESLNRITQILFQAKADAVQKEKYYELIMNSVNTGIIVLDDTGNIFQTNNEALRLLGLSVFTHVKQLARIDDKLQATIANILPGDKHQISFVNERGTVNLSIRVSEMTLQEKLGQRLAAGFQGLEPPEEFLRLIKEYKVGNIILFRRNIQDGPQLKKLCATLRKVVEEETGVTPFITIDQEGGVVTRLPESEVNIPGAMAVAATGNPRNAYDMGLLTAQELRSCGVDFNLAPVMDINCNPDNPVIGVRSYGDTPERVAEYGSQMVRGLLDGGVYCSLKHFPLQNPGVTF